MEYELIRSDRRTLAIRVLPSGAVQVRAPKRMARRDVDEALARHAGWIENKRRQLSAAAPEPGELLTPAELKALTEAARSDLAARTARLGPQVGVTWGKITVRHQKTRWGSCSAAGDLSFNCLLMLCPPEIRDYVVLHELCHRRQMNHTPAFWAEVSRMMPDWPARRRWLRTNGPGLMRRMTGCAPDPAPTIRSKRYRF